MNSAVDASEFKPFVGEMHAYSCVACVITVMSASLTAFGEATPLLETASRVFKNSFPWSVMIPCRTFSSLTLKGITLSPRAVPTSLSAWLKNSTERDSIFNATRRVVTQSRRESFATGLPAERYPSGAKPMSAARSKAIRGVAAFAGGGGMASDARAPGAVSGSPEPSPTLARFEGGAASRASAVGVAFAAASASEHACTAALHCSTFLGHLYMNRKEFLCVMLSLRTFVGPPKAMTSPSFSGTGPVGMRFPFK